MIMSQAPKTSESMSMTHYLHVRTIAQEWIDNTVCIFAFKLIILNGKYRIVNDYFRYLEFF